MNKFGLEEKYLNYILDILSKNIPNSAYYIFGSRAKGNYKEYSDIDIAVKSSDKIPSDTMSKVMLEFENSTLPYEVDVVDLDSIKPDFKNLIIDSLVKLN